MQYSREYLWREAARFAGYRWTEFLDLDGDVMAGVIAHYETHAQIQAVIDNEHRN